METCISFVTGSYRLVVKAQRSHFKVYLCQHLERQGDEEHLEGVLLAKDAPESWQRAAMNLAIDECQQTIYTMMCSTQ